LPEQSRAEKPSGQ
jgi:hypothetical protein